MPWVRAAFKDAKVWAEVTEAGALQTEGGKVAIRYSNKAGAKRYMAGAAGVRAIAGASPEALPGDGGAAESKPKKSSRGSGFGSAGTRSKSQQAAAKQDAASRLAALPAGTAVAYTDGGCSGNPGPAGSGVRLELPDGRVVEASRALGHGTNNIAELTAIEMALELMDEAELPGDAAAVVFSDSSYARGVLTLGWKAKANVELITGLRKRWKARSGVELQWVAGHSGIPGNERADALATAAVSGRTQTTWS